MSKKEISAVRRGEVNIRSVMKTLGASFVYRIPPHWIPACGARE